jgi:hypothetical protein
MRLSRFVVGFVVLAAAAVQPAYADGPAPLGGTLGSVNFGNPFGNFQATSLITVAGTSANNALYSTPKGMGYDGVGALQIQANNGSYYICSGALLSDRVSILTAGHCLSDQQAGGWRAVAVTPVFFPSTSANGVRAILPPTSTFFVNPGYTGQVIDANDVAIVRLAAPAPAGVTGYDIFRSNAIGSDFRIVGSGAAGTGNTGYTINPGYNQSNRRTGLNRYDFSFTDSEWGGYWDDANYFGTANPNVYLADFDNGLAANDASCRLAGLFGLGGPKFCNLGLGVDEVSTGGGDSGGPQFVNGLISGVTSFGLTWGTQTGDLNNTLNGTFGEFAGFARTDINASWIDSVVTPEPVSLMLLATGFALMGGMGALRRRRSEPEA